MVHELASLLFRVVLLAELIPKNLASLDEVSMFAWAFVRSRSSIGLGFLGTFGAVELATIRRGLALLLLVVVSLVLVRVRHCRHVDRQTLCENLVPKNEGSSPASVVRPNTPFPGLKQFLLVCRVEGA